MDLISLNPPGHLVSILRNSPFCQITNGFHRAFATGIAGPQRTLTPRDTWFSSICGLEYVQLVETKSVSQIVVIVISIFRYFLDFASTMNETVQLLECRIYSLGV